MTTEIEMIGLRREFLAKHGLTINSARMCGPARKAKLSAEFAAWLAAKGVADGNDPRWRATPTGARAQ